MIKEIDDSGNNMPQHLHVSYYDIKYDPSKNDEYFTYYNYNKDFLKLQRKMSMTETKDPFKHDRIKKREEHKKW